MCLNYQQRSNRPDIIFSFPIFIARWKSPSPSQSVAGSTFPRHRHFRHRYRIAASSLCFNLVAVRLVLRLEAKILMRRSEEHLTIAFVSSFPSHKDRGHFT